MVSTMRAEAMSRHASVMSVTGNDGHERGMEQWLIWIKCPFTECGPFGSSSLWRVCV